MASQTRDPGEDGLAGGQTGPGPRRIEDLEAVLFTYSVHPQINAS